MLGHEVDERCVLRIGFHGLGAGQRFGANAEVLLPHWHDQWQARLGFVLWLAGHGLFGGPK